MLFDLSYEVSNFSINFIPEACKMSNAAKFDSELRTIKQIHLAALQHVNTFTWHIHFGF